MAWLETESRSFTARHDAAQSAEARRLLARLERTHARLSEYFPRPTAELTVVLHASTTSLLVARPQMALSWALTAPPARRYVIGYGGSHELHVLSGEAMTRRVAPVTGSREMLHLAAPALYAHQLIVANNDDLQSVFRPARRALMLRWAWLFEGAARWFVGQTDHARAAIARRLREGAEPSFPPSVRDAALLGGTVIDLLAREEGERAAAALAGRLHRRGPRAALGEAFGGRALAHTEGAWRRHLARLAGAPGQ